MTEKRQVDILEFIRQRGGSTEIVNIVPWAMQEHNAEEQHVLRTLLTMASRRWIILEGSEFTKIKAIIAN